MSPAPNEISCSEVRRLLANDCKIALVDCRETEEHELVAIKGAMLLPMSELPERIHELKGKELEPLIVYCHHGVRSAQVAAWLQEQGFSQAVSMAGGIDAWALEIEPGMARY